MENTSPANFLQAELVLDAKAELGEGAFWHPQEQRLYWVDIEGKKLHLYDPATGQDRTIDVGERIGTVVPTPDGKALVALQNGIHLLHLGTEELTLIANPLESEDIRFNDGKCDPAGRFWVGSMHLEQEENAAALYRMNLDGSVQKILSGKTISNGIVWTADRKTMYYIDTPTRQVTAYDYDHATGDISNPRVAVEVPEEAGNPDGMAIDAEDKLWVAHYGGHAVIRYDPETGERMQKIELSAPNVTSCAFGGEDLDTLYITTAREGMDEGELEKYPQSGGLFWVKPGVRGAVFTLFKGSL
ncbi:SMP-30/gluconolactonase/LRE family protein [soil metagenome]